VNEASRVILELHPRGIRVSNNGTVAVRLMEKTDRNRIVEFARALPPDELLFLRKDITDPVVVDEWVRDIEAGRTVTVLAERDDELLGYCSLWRDESFWGRHVGEIRLLIRPDCRGLGLGRRLSFDVFAIAKDLGLEKIIARMTPAQERTQANLKRLGFTLDAVLRGFVRDREDKARDLLIMSSDVSGLTNAEHRTVWQHS
jgi:RimJ/RimL family protein N-acetyltransferase